ncbi:ribonuclease regulator, partial [Vibrio echinoideorum]
SFNSSLHTYKDEEEDNDKSVAAEVSSRVHLTDNLDLHATLDYEERQQGVELGLVFRF